MNSTIRNEEKKAVEKKPESDASFQRIVDNIMGNNKHDKNVKKLAKVQIDESKVIQKSNEAVFKSLMIDQEKWLKQRKSNPQLHNLEIAKQIKSMLDPSDSGNIKFDDFLRFLLEIGVPLKPKIIQSILMTRLKFPATSNKNIKLQHISSLCRGSKRANQALLVLNASSSNFFYKPEKEVTSADHKKLIKTWWKNLDSLQKNQVFCNVVCEFLASHGFFNDFSESKKYVMKVTNSQPFLDYDQFLSIFGEALVKYVLININAKFSLEDWNSPVYSYAYKLCQLKRHLILAGINFPVSNISLEEGSLVLKAINNYTEFKGDKPEKINYEDFKAEWYQHTGLRLDTNTIPPCKTLDSEEIEVELAGFHSKEEEKSAFESRYSMFRRSKGVIHTQNQSLKKRLTLNTGISKIESLKHSPISHFPASFRNNKPITKAEKFTAMLNEYQSLLNKII